MVTQPALYNEVTKIAEDYFGPIAQRFIDRLIYSHLKKQPSQLKRSDLPQLSLWTKLTLASITDDEQIIEEFAQRLKALGSRH